MLGTHTAIFHSFVVAIRETFQSNKPTDSDSFVSFQGTSDLPDYQTDCHPNTATRHSRSSLLRIYFLFE